MGIKNSLLFHRLCIHCSALFPDQSFPFPNPSGFSTPRLPAPSSQSNSPSFLFLTNILRPLRLMPAPDASTEPSAFPPPVVIRPLAPLDTSLPNNGLCYILVTSVTDPTIRTFLYLNDPNNVYLLDIFCLARLCIFNQYVAKFVRLMDPGVAAAVMESIVNGTAGDKKDADKDGMEKLMRTNLTKRRRRRLTSVLNEGAAALSISVPSFDTQCNTPNDYPSGVQRQV